MKELDESASKNPIYSKTIKELAESDHPSILIKIHDQLEQNNISVDYGNMEHVNQKLIGITEEVMNDLQLS